MTNETIGWIVIAAMSLASGGFLLATPWLRRTLGPVRAPVHEPIGAWGSAVFVGGLVWLGSQVVYGAYLGTTRAATQPAGTDHSLILTARELALLSSLPATLAAIAMLAIAASTRGQLTRLGLSPRSIPAGVALGLMGLILAYPLVFWASMGFQQLYRLIQFQHPTEHEVLQRLAEQPDATTSRLLIIGAVVAAPVFEELFFRGGLQTLLRWMFARLSGSQETTAGAWGAIAIASLVFASVHPMWMAPMLFVLSCAIGYLYERTGNLWGCIALHALFNGLNTAAFLSNG